MKLLKSYHTKASKLWGGLGYDLCSNMPNFEIEQIINRKVPTMESKL